MTAQTGYTLLELLVVLAIIGLLTAIAMPMLSSSRPALDARAAARAVADDLKAARERAIDTAVTEAFHVSPATGRYGTGRAWRAVANGVALAFRGEKRDEIDFYPDGSATAGTIFVSSGTTRHRVTVRWPSGQIDIDD